MIQGDRAVAASALRRRAHESLGRDSESLSDRFFSRVLRDAHDADIIDLRRRGDDFEVALPAQVAPVAEQLNRAAAAHAAPTPTNATTATVVRGMGPRGIPAKGRGGARVLPPNLLMVGVVETPAAAVPPPPAVEPVAAPTKGRTTKAKTTRAKTKVASADKPATTDKPAAKKKARAPRAKKAEATEKA
jgi:hypothetical protein